MIKRFCDRCGIELVKDAKFWADVQIHATGSHEAITFNTSWSNPDYHKIVCESCYKGAVQALKDWESGYKES